MTNFFKRLWLRRWFRVCMWIAVGLVAAAPIEIPILLREYIDWSGRRRWAAVQEMLAREGESLDLHKVAPDPVPDDQNFFAIPALKDLASCTPNDNTSELGLKRKRLIDAGLPHDVDRTVPWPKLSTSADDGKAVDLQAWAEWLRKEGWLPAGQDSGDPAQDVLAGLSRNDALIGELAPGLSRPESQWTPAWKTRVLPGNPFMIALPQYAVAQSLTPMLCLRSDAAASAGDSEKAHQSLLIAVRIDQAFVQEPLLIGTLVGIGCSFVINSTVWELCKAHSGTADDFRTLQEELSRLDFQKSLLYAQRGELAGGTTAMEYMKRKRDLSFLEPFPMSFDASDRNVTSFALRLLPDGWYDANAATIAEWDFEYSIKPLRDAGFNEVLARQKELNVLIGDEGDEWYAHLDDILARIAVPAELGATRRVIYAQSLVNEAVAACALERYRTEHNAYPDTLEEANRPGEKSIPLDIISGKPMGYRKTSDGRYVLWCVGFTGKDNGGRRVLDKEHPELTRFSAANYTGDWVWDYPAQ